MFVEPYLFFNGHCERAIEYYQQTLGAEVQFMMRYQDSPDLAQIPPGMEQKVMHANLKIGDSVVMVSDGCCSGTATFEGVSLSLAFSDLPAAEKVFNALAADGEVIMPFAKTFWSPGFGQVKDQFGVVWMVNVVDEEWQPG